MDSRDVCLQAVTPTVMVPRFGQFEPLTRPGHRFLVAADGLWIEVRRAWLYVRRRIAAQSQVAMPYGQLDPLVQFTCPAVPTGLVQQFSALARRDCPIEVAGWIVWNEHSNAFDFRAMDPLSASAGHIRYDRPALAAGEHLVIDWHSHGTGRAFFSGTDNRDDAGEVKVSGVLGRCDQDRLDMALRLCVLGIYIKLDAVVTAEGVTLAEKTESKEREEWSTSSNRTCSLASFQ